MLYRHTTIELQARPRGFHLITEEIVRQLVDLECIEVGTLVLFLRHTSASLTINENADPTVRSDLEQWVNRYVKECEDFYQHDYEGDDDMPAHIKSSLFGTSVTIPVVNGQLSLGTWQGIYLGEHRNRGGSRKISAVLQGQVAN